MTVADIKDWLKSQITGAGWSTGALKTTEEKTIVVYGTRGYVNPKAVGMQSSYRGKGIRVFIHWNLSTIESELKAQEIYDLLNSRPDVTIAGERVVQFILRDPEPISLGPDDYGINEYIIDAELIITGGN